jgi:hypothetical protein
MMDIQCMNCCGVGEIADINDHEKPAEVLMAGGIHLLRYGHHVFTDTHYQQNLGPRLARYLKRCNLGKVINTKYAYNQNSGNKVMVWVWTVDKPRLVKWFKRRGKNYSYHDEAEFPEGYPDYGEF